MFLIYLGNEEETVGEPQEFDWDGFYLDTNGQIKNKQTIDFGKYPHWAIRKITHFYIKTYSGKTVRRGRLTDPFYWSKVSWPIFQPGALEFKGGPYEEETEWYTISLGD